MSEGIQGHGSTTGSKVGSVGTSVRWAGLMAALLGLAGHVWATRIIHQTLVERCREATLIFEGTVVRKEIQERKGPEGYGPGLRKWTVVTFKIQDLLKGQATRGEVSLPFLGWNPTQEEVKKMKEGTSWAGFIAGTPMFDVGEHVILLCDETVSWKISHPIVGWWEGAFRLRAGSDGTERAYQGDRAERPVARVRDGDEVFGKSGASSEMTLEQMKREIRECLKRAPPR